MSKRSGILLVLPFVIAVCVAGCGSNDSTVAPVVDTVAPAAVLDLEAVVVSGAVELNWSAGTEADLAGYRVFRAVNNGSAELVGVETSNTFRDGTVTTGVVYRYEVSTFDTSGNESSRVVKTVSVGGSTDPGRGGLDG